MSLHTEAHNQQQLTITLELLSEGKYEADQVVVNAVGRDVVNTLQQDGYLIQPVNTGQRGWEFLIQIITTLTTDATNLAVGAWAQKEIFERVLTDAGSLVTVCVSVVPILKRLTEAHKQRSPQGNPPQPLKITVEIDGAPVTVEAADLEQAEAGLQLAERFYKSHPAVAKKVTSQSKVKAKGTVAPQPQRKRK